MNWPVEFPLCCADLIALILLLLVLSFWTENDDDDDDYDVVVFVDSYQLILIHYLCSFRLFLVRIHFDQFDWFGCFLFACCLIRLLGLVFFYCCKFFFLWFFKPLYFWNVHFDSVNEDKRIHRRVQCVYNLHLNVSVAKYYALHWPVSIETKTKTKHIRCDR